MFWINASTRSEGDGNPETGDTSSHLFLEVDVEYILSGLSAQNRTTVWLLARDIGASRSCDMDRDKYEDNDGGGGGGSDSGGITGFHSTATILR